MVGFLGVFYALRAFVWGWLQAVTESKMPAQVAAQHEIIVTTPFEVILLQAKTGIIVGIIIAIPALVYLSRHELQARGYWIQDPISGWKFIGVFTFFYMGGMRLITQDFVSRMPATIVSTEDIHIIDFYPVETVMFIIKVSTLVGLLAIVPLSLYFAWPAMRERGLIGFLVYDTVQGGMLISYRISSFSWLIIYTTVGVGLLACIPATMWMLFRGKLASYSTMRHRWREITIAVFVVVGVSTSAGVLTMVLVAIPIMLAYRIGLAGLWIVTVGGRLDFRNRVGH